MKSQAHSPSNVQLDLSLLSRRGPQFQESYIRRKEKQLRLRKLRNMHLSAEGQIGNESPSHVLPELNLNTVSVTSPRRGLQQVRTKKAAQLKTPKIVNQNCTVIKPGELPFNTKVNSFLHPYRAMKRYVEEQVMEEHNISGQNSLYNNINVMATTITDQQENLSE